MSIIPSFLLKKIYKKGSLRHIEEGIAFDLKNILAPGLITGVNFVQINDTIYNSNVIQIIKSGANTFAEQISSENPLLIKLNEEITCVMQSGLKLKEGLNNIIVELISHDVGKVQVTLTDTI